MTDWGKLVERVQGLTGPDRETDWLISEALGLASKIGPENENFMFERPTGHQGYFLQNERLGPNAFGSSGWQSVFEIPPYTASLDAAMRLIPRGWFTFMAMQDKNSFRWKWHLRSPNGLNRYAWASTAPTALCAAVLLTSDKYPRKIVETTHIVSKRADDLPEIPKILD